MINSENRSMQQGTILFVDDEASILKTLRRVFHSESCEMLFAESAAEGLTLLETNKVHVVVSDQRMADMVGSEFLAQVRQQYPDVMRITMSGYADMASVIACINHAHIDHFIPKPWDTEELKSVVLHYLGIALKNEQQATQKSDYFYPSEMD